MTWNSRPAALAALCLLAPFVSACDDPPTQPTPGPPVVEAPSDPPPPAPPPRIPIAGEYDAILRVSAACADSPIGPFFENLPEKTRSRRYAATVSGPSDEAVVNLAGPHLKLDPIWAFGTTIGISQNGQRVTLRTWSGWVPDVVDEVRPGESLTFSIHGGDGEVVAGRVEVTWRGRISLVDTADPGNWRTLAGCDAEDHELFLLPRPSP